MRFTYYLVLVFVRCFKFIPFKILYLFSDFLRFIFLHIFKYRKKVVTKNLQNSFPEKSDKQIEILVKKFYKNLCDIVVESVKGFTMNEEQFRKRYHFINPELLNEYFDNGINTISMGSHYANWEWGIIAASKSLKHSLIAFYTPLSNIYIDNYIKKKRKQLGTELMSTKEYGTKLKMNDGEVKSVFFGADQSPISIKRAIWFQFLNQDTAWMTGAELFARRYKLPVFYIDIQRVKRGYYSAEIVKLEENPENTVPGELTKKYAKFLEELIIKKPEDYLWSHRRWKHKRSD